MKESTSEIIEMIYSLWDIYSRFPKFSSIFKKFPDLYALASSPDMTSRKRKKVSDGIFPNRQHHMSLLCHPRFLITILLMKPSRKFGIKNDMLPCRGIFIVLEENEGKYLLNLLHPCTQSSIHKYNSASVLH